jgi:hypothetical protein
MECESQTFTFDENKKIKSKKVIVSNDGFISIKPYSTNLPEIKKKSK